MLDYKFIKDNLDAVKQNIINRNMTADADKVVELFDKRTALVTKLQGLQQKRNENAQAMKQKLDPEKRNELIAAGKAIKDEITSVEAETKETEAALEEAARQIPNMVHPDAPVGKLDTSLTLNQKIMFSLVNHSTSSTLTAVQRYLVQSSTILKTKLYSLSRL